MHPFFSYSFASFHGVIRCRQNTRSSLRTTVSGDGLVNVYLQWVLKISAGIGTRAENTAVIEPCN